MARKRPELPLIARERWQFALSVIKFSHHSVRVDGDALVLTTQGDSQGLDDNLADFLEDLHYLTGMIPVVLRKEGNCVVIRPAS